MTTMMETDLFAKLLIKSFSYPWLWNYSSLSDQFAAQSVCNISSTQV